MVLLVDDWHMIVAASGVVPPMAPLFPLLPAAADIGLHIIVTCQMSQAHRATMDKFVGAAYGAGSPTMFLSGEKQEFPSSEIKFSAAPWPGISRLAGRQGGHPGGLSIHRKKKCLSTLAAVRINQTLSNAGEDASKGIGEDSGFKQRLSGCG